MLNNIWEARAKWYHIGVNLGTSPGTLDAIEKAKNQNPDDCMIAMINDWLNSGTPTWEALAGAPMVGYIHLAEQVLLHKI